MLSRIALFGGIYNNYLALEAALRDIKRRGVDAIYCLGDFGAFGPHPDRVFPLIWDYQVECIQGNYDQSLALGLSDCQCGYTDPRDNYFARISYEYTYEHTSPQNRQWLGTLPTHRRVQLGRYRVLLCHGSPRKINEFLWESTTSTAFLRWLCQTYDADVICATHTGIKWHRALGNANVVANTVSTENPAIHSCNEGQARPPDWHFVNVGVLGRPENDGTTRVWYTILEATPQLRVEFVPVEYDYQRLAREMREERLPEEFIATILSGWWTTCLEILPAKERKRGRF
ncbi:MAG: metallophosphoesterase family protein [Gemmatales bacterium]|nr:metallophosphatase family protein [Gemmatales bacterium]MDW7994254.1 metallophosphoesterase family protein [Gemmatales bacterium]